MLRAPVLAFSVLCAAATQPHGQPPEVLGLPLGRATIGDVLYVLGSPAAIYLADEENPKPSNAIVLRYDARATILTYQGEVDVVVSPASYLVTRVHLRFRDLPSPTVLELAALYGSPTYYRLEPACGPDSESCSEFCSSPNGSIRKAVFRNAGLAAYLRDGSSDSVIFLEFALDIWRRGVAYPPCKSGV